MEDEKRGESGPPKFCYDSQLPSCLSCIPLKRSSFIQPYALCTCPVAVTYGVRGHPFHLPPNTTCTQLRAVTCFYLCIVPLSLAP